MKAKLGRFHTLDGMRGVAALLVAADHLAQRHNGVTSPCYLTVDIFFVISGFVIALNYSEKFSGGLSTTTFMKLRAIRLFPLYLLGLAVGLGKQMLGHLLNDHRAMGGAILACNIVFATIMIPSACSETLFPLNGPFWSTFFEVAINLMFAAFLWRTPTQIIAVVMVIAALYFLVTIRPPLYFNLGWSWRTFLGGVARMSFSFSAGILIFRHFPRAHRQASWICLAPIAVLIVILRLHPFVRQTYIEFGAVVVLFPLLVMSGIRLEAPEAIARLFAFLGDISYPIYAIHWPLIAMALPTFKRLDLTVNAEAAVFVAALIPISYLAARVDEIVRRRISNQLKVRRTAALQAI